MHIEGITFDVVGAAAGVARNDQFSLRNIHTNVDLDLEFVVQSDLGHVKLSPLDHCAGSVGRSSARHSSHSVLDHAVACRSQQCDAVDRPTRALVRLGVRVPGKQMLSADVCVSDPFSRAVKC